MGHARDAKVDTVVDRVGRTEIEHLPNVVDHTLDPVGRMGGGVGTFNAEAIHRLEPNRLVLLCDRLVACLLSFGSGNDFVVDISDVHHEIDGEPFVAKMASKEIIGRHDPAMP